MKYFKIVVLYCVCSLFNSCVDFIDNYPDDTLTMEMVFNDKTRMEDWLSGVYNMIPDPYSDFFRNHGYDILGDDLDPSQRLTQWDYKVFLYRIGQWYTDSSWKGDLLKGAPIRIRSAYLFIENAHALPDQGVSEEDIEVMKNECRFLVAYYYWLMLETYGAVSFYDGLVALDDPNIMRGQETFDSMVDWIDNQLVDLSKKLPESWLDKSTQFYGRATSIMCLAVRARMLLFAASPLVNGNEWYKDFKNFDSRERFSQSYDAGKWKRAADACKELIDAAHAAGHDLVREYNADGSIDPFMSCYNVYFLRGDVNPEILFPRPNTIYGKDFEAHCTPRGASGNGHLGVTQTLVDAFYMKDGSVPIVGYLDNYGTPIINQRSGYTERGFSPRKDIRKTKYNLYRGCPGATVDSVGKDGCTYNQVASEGTFNMYVNREPRFYLTVMWNRQWYHQAKRNTLFMYGESDGGPTHDAPQGGYLNRKKVSLEQNHRNNIHPYRPGILYRLGEAYLNYVEALNECNPDNPDIIKYLNLIRERAGVPQYGTGIDSNGFEMIPLEGQDEVRQAIYRERRVELCCEDGIRYFDLRRWKKAEEVLNQPFYGMNFLGTKLSDDPNDPKAYFTRVPYLTRVYERKFYWWPIYQGEIDKDPTLVQAPFWDNE